MANHYTWDNEKLFILLTESSSLINDESVFVLIMARHSVSGDMLSSLDN